MIEEPVQQPRPRRSQSRHPGSIPSRCPRGAIPDEEVLVPPLGPIAPEPAWPSTVVRAPAETRLPRRGVRRTRVEVRRLGPLSVLKFSLIFYFCIFLVVYLALAIIWGILSASGAIDSLEQLLGDIFPSAAALVTHRRAQHRRGAAARDRHGTALHLALHRRMRRRRDLVVHQRVHRDHVQPDQRHRRWGRGHARRPSRLTGRDSPGLSIDTVSGP